MIYVCDAIMGTGKTSATITYLNEHKGERFIYITPYLDEAARIKAGCPEMRFVEPSNGIKSFNYTKKGHTADLIRQGKNIATTHQAFKGYSSQMLDDIRSGGYTLIIDENVDVLEKYEIHPGDLQMAFDAGYIKEENGEISLTEKEYKGCIMSELFSMMQSRKLIRSLGAKEGELYYWALPPELITSFKNVYVLTYLFEGQSLHHFFKMHGLPYEKIGVQKIDDGWFRFCEYPGYTPEYVHHIKDMLHIIDGQRMNEIGDSYYALSMSWFNHGGSDVEQLKLNVSNFFNNLNRGADPMDRLCGAYKCAVSAIKGKGYSKSFIAYNTKATNAYRNCTNLAYVTNIFMDVGTKLLYTNRGIDVDEDMYALSIMVQWIWRSAIRDGNEVYLYLPSKRMRMILTDWMDSISKGGESNGN